VCQNGSTYENVRTIERTTLCVRCPEEIKEIGSIDGIQIISKRFIGIDGLPEEVEGTFYVVSLPVAQAGKMLGRKDLLIPGTVVRNDLGQIVGCLNLAVV
jgi:hypothetical protein